MQNNDFVNHRVKIYIMFPNFISKTTFFSGGFIAISFQTAIVLHMMVAYTRGDLAILGPGTRGWVQPWCKAKAGQLGTHGWCWCQVYIDSFRGVRRLQKWHPQWRSWRSRWVEPRRDCYDRVWRVDRRCPKVPFKVPRFSTLKGPTSCATWFVV